MCGQGEDLSQVQKGDIAIQGAIYNSQTQQVQFLGCPESVLKGCSELQAVSGTLRVQVKSLGREKSSESKFLARLICLCILLWATSSSSATNVSTLPLRKMSTRGPRDKDRGQFAKQPHKVSCKGVSGRCKVLQVTY